MDKTDYPAGKLYPALTGYFRFVAPKPNKDTVVGSRYSKVEEIRRLGLLSPNLTISILDIIKRKLLGTSVLLYYNRDLTISSFTLTRSYCSTTFSFNYCSSKLQLIVIQSIFGLSKFISLWFISFDHRKFISFAIFEKFNSS